MELRATTAAKAKHYCTLFKRADRGPSGQVVFSSAGFFQFDPDGSQRHRGLHVLQLMRGADGQEYDSAVLQLSVE